MTTKRQPQTFTVERHGSDSVYIIRGLADDFDEAPDTTFICRGHYPEVETPEVLPIRNGKAMHSALYDLLQTHDGLRDGDRFVTPFGEFVCVSFHVVDAADEQEVRAEMAKYED